MKKLFIEDMTPTEICRYLNHNNHTLPIIMKHGEGYSVFWNIINGFSKKYKEENNLTKEEAIKIFINIQ